MNEQSSKKLLIIGCGRAGTSYISHVLKNIGLDIAHETYGKDGLSNWYFAPGSKMSHGPYGAGILFGQYKYEHVFHQIRHPLKTISSSQRFTPGSWRYAFRYIPITVGKSLLYNCMEYWLYWNQIAEEISEWSYRIEDFQEQFLEFCERIEEPDLFNEKSCQVIRDIPTNINSRTGRFVPATWDVLWKEDEELCKLILNQARRYGYEIDYYKNKGKKI